MNTIKQIEKLREMENKLRDYYNNGYTVIESIDTKIDNTNRLHINTECSGYYIITYDSYGYNCFLQSTGENTNNILDFISVYEKFSYNIDIKRFKNGIDVTN